MTEHPDHTNQSKERNLLPHSSENTQLGSAGFRWSLNQDSVCTIASLSWPELLLVAALCWLKPTAPALSPTCSVSLAQRIEERDSLRDEAIHRSCCSLLRELSGCALVGGMVLYGSLATFYIKVLNIFMYVNFFFFNFKRNFSFLFSKGGRLKVLYLRPLFIDEEVEAQGGRVICYSPPASYCLQGFISHLSELECHGT